MYTLTSRTGGHFGARFIFTEDTSGEQIELLYYSPTDIICSLNCEAHSNHGGRCYWNQRITDTYPYCLDKHPELKTFLLLEEL